MTSQIIDGKFIAKQIKADIRDTINHHLALKKRRPGLAVILVGSDPASEVYVRNKRESCEQVGITSLYHHLPEQIQEADLTRLIQDLNENPEVDGILLQLPLPKHIDANHILEQISIHKDVDGFHPYNIGRLAERRPLLRPCTPRGIMILLETIKQSFKGKHAVIVGASNIVGRPLALELLIAGATITVCHRFTDNLPYFTKQADILISAVGKPQLIKGEWIKEGATVIDVGITRLSNGTLTGDIEFAKACERAAWITPVPGGVGPMTVAMLLHNTIIAAGLLPYSG